MTPTLTTPFDVKLMNLTASLLFVAFALLLAGALAGWAASHPVFALRAIAVTGEVTHNNAVTLRANVTPPTHWRRSMTRRCCVNSSSVAMR